VSALSGVTNELTAIAGGADDAGARVDALVERHRAFARELGLEPDAVLGGRLAALRALLDDARAPGRRLDWQAEVLAQGELLSSTRAWPTCARRAWISAGPTRATGWMRSNCPTRATGAGACRPRAGARPTTTGARASLPS